MENKNYKGNEQREQSLKEKRIRSNASVYYSRPDVQKVIFEFCKKRETVPRFFEGFGKRPDELQFPGDVFELVKKGTTSFQCSEEIWEDPMKIETGMSKEKLNEFRKGWDLLIDIDCKYFDYSKKATQAIVRFLKKHGIENMGVKFSVSGDTPILIRNKGEISLLSISNAIELLKKDEQLEVLSLDKNKKLRFSKIYDFLEHKDTVYEITHSQSTVPLKATGHHSVFVWDKGEIVEKKVTDIKKRDFLVSYNSLKNPFADKSNFVINKFVMKKNQHSSEKSTTKKTKLNKDLMRLIGYFLAQGHVTNIINQVGFSFNKNEKKYIEDVKSLLSEITKRKISIRHPNSGSTQILIHSKEWASFFDNYCGKKKNKHVPSFAWTSSKELFLELLKGYIRGDGYKIGEYVIVAKSVSKRLITELIWLCRLNNISCNMSSEQNKPHNLPPGNYFKGSLVYMLRIPKSGFEDIEFNRKRNKFSPHGGSKIFPTDGLKEVYKQIKPKMFNYHRNEQMTLKKKRANINRIKKVLEWFKNFNENSFSKSSKRIISNYEKLIDSDTSILEVKEKTKKSREKVYDVSVENTESFFGNYYPVLLHNSGSKGFHILVPWKAFPKEIGEEKTSNLFPQLPRKIVSYIRQESEKEMKSMLPEDFESQFKDIEIKKGIKCNNCGEIAEEIEKKHFYCPKCHREETKKIHKNSPEAEKEYKCPDCKIPFEIDESNSKTIYECKKCGISSEERPDNFSRHIETDIFELMGLDLVLVAPRHLFRAPYSLHEKTSLASIPIQPTEEAIEKFDMKDASPFKVEVKPFSPAPKENEASQLVREAIDWYEQNKPKEDKDHKPQGKYTDFKPVKLKEILDKNFPPAIQTILKGVYDGRKRALFVLINFFRSIGMEKENMEKRVYDWNEKNSQSLQKGYIKSQLSWSYRRKPLLPPNYDKDYYQGIGVIPTEEERRHKNPVNYTIKKSLQEQSSKSKKIKSSKKFSGKKEYSPKKSSNHKNSYKNK